MNELDPKFAAFCERFSLTVFGLIGFQEDYKWSERDHVLLAGLLTFGGFLGIVGFPIELITHRWLDAAQAGAFGISSLIVAAWSWRRWAVMRRCATR